MFRLTQVIKPSSLIQVKQAGSSGAPAPADQNQEVGHLRAEMEKKTLVFEEELARREAQHSAELKALRKELRDAESQQLALQKEILVLKDKLDKIRRERYLNDPNQALLLSHCLTQTSALCVLTVTAV